MKQVKILKMTRETTVLVIGLQVQVIVPQAEIDHELLGVAEFMIVVQPTNVCTGIIVYL